MSELNFERGSEYSWDLQAIVKGQGKANNNMNHMVGISNSYNWVEKFDDQEYYQNQETNATKLINELHQLCNTNLHNISNICSSKTVENTAITTIDDHESSKCYLDEPKQDITTNVSSSNTTIAPRKRRNKNKKTTIHHATGDRVLSDKWNWRKYGEKVIKGSPYPRSYYRCSNAKGCLARKQVEQSNTDNGKFLITYIDEHNHSYPSRRPSQAGRTSRRFHASSNLQQVLATNEPESSTGPRAIAPPIVEWDNNANDHCVFEDDFFQGLEYLEGLDMDFICDTSSYCDSFLFSSNFGRV